MKGKKKAPVNRWLVLTSIPIQMFVVIYLAFRLGLWFDERFDFKNEIAMKILTLVGVFVALCQVINQVKQINNDE